MALFPFFFFQTASLPHSSHHVFFLLHLSSTLLFPFNLSVVLSKLICLLFFLPFPLLPSSFLCFFQSLSHHIDVITGVNTPLVVMTPGLISDGSQHTVRGSGSWARSLDDLARVRTTNHKDAPDASDRHDLRTERAGYLLKIFLKKKKERKKTPR